MGKLNGVDADYQGGKYIKRDIVSANLEVVSEESFNRKLAGMSSCENCQRERTKGHHSKKHNKKGKWKRQQVKTKSPIVIHLKDTLKKGAQQRQSSVEMDSEPSSPLDYSGASSHYYGSYVPPYFQYSAKSMFREFKNAHKLSEKSNKKDNKNLDALISNIEKAHLKPNYGMEYNLSREVERDSKISDTLNNANCSTDATDSSISRSIINRDNVELICNDLYNSSSSSSDKSDSGTLDDSESEHSSITSSVENLSDAGDSGIPAADDGSTFQFLPEELERLASYTTGFPLFRYDCPPSHCPECMNAWTNYQYYNYQGYNLFSNDPKASDTQESPGAKLTASSSLEDEDEEEDEDVANVTIQPDYEQSEESNASRTNSTATPPHRVAISVQKATEATEAPTKQLLDIGISNRRNQSYHNNPFPDSVYMDLTGTDVKVTVYYEQNLLPSSMGTDSYASSGSLYVPPHWSSSYYWPSYYMPPSYGLSSHVTALMDMSLPKTVMVPPHELKKFNATVPPNRQWITIADPDHSQPVALFTVMCYNVLCDKYCTRQQYGYCPSWALNWDYRKKGIIDEIRNYNADIISLQEVETEQFHNFFLPELKREGYEGIFEPKSRAKTMTEQEKKHVDGCAIFYKRKKFTLIKEQLIEFNQIAMANAEGSADMLNRVMTKDNIGLIALLETKEFIYEQGKAPLDCQTRRQIMVATAHIHWDPEYCDVKLIQTMMLMWELRNIIEETLQQFRPNSGAVKDVNSMPLLLCGDLNSLPDSGVVEYLTNSKVAANHIDFKEMGYENCLKKLNPNISDKESLTHCFRLGRAYSDSEIMPNTNYTYDFKGIIDYIFYSRDHMKLLGMLGAIDDEWFKQNKIIGCPHPHVPSDHFSLLVQFEMPLPRSPVSASNSSSSRSITASKR